MENKEFHQVLEEPAVSLPVVILRKGEPPKFTEQWVVEEIPVTLFFNNEQMITLLCAGYHLDELAVGFFIAEGWIRERNLLKDVQVDKQKGIVNIIYEGERGSSEKFWLKRAITSGCAKGSVLCDVLDKLLERPMENSVTLDVSTIWTLMEKLNSFSQVYKKTHGVHNSLIGNSYGEVEKSRKGFLFRCDIGRHNALDMLIGRAFLDEIDLSDKAIVTTGRLTSEVVIKAAQAGVPILVSRHTATRLAVELAVTLNMTLVGYVRGGQMTVYHDGGRLKW